MCLLLFTCVMCKYACLCVVILTCAFTRICICVRMYQVHVYTFGCYVNVDRGANMRMYVPMYVHAQVCVCVCLRQRPFEFTMVDPTRGADRSLNSVPLPPPLDSSAASVCLGSSGPLNLTFTSQGHQRTVQPGVNTAIHTSDKYKMHQKI